MNHDPSTRHILEGRELIDYLVEKTSSTANAELLRREERRSRRTTILLSVLTAVGIGGAVGAIKMVIADKMHVLKAQVEGIYDDLEVQRKLDAKALKQHVQDQIAAGVGAQVEEQVGQLRTELYQYKTYQELIEQAVIIDRQVNAGKVPYQAINYSIEYIEALATADSVTDQTRFLDIVNVVIDLLVRSDRNTDIDRLEEVLRDKLVSHKDIALNLTDHYGQVIISSPYPVEKLTKEFEALTRYARASREMKYPEKALLWELFVAFQSSRYERTSISDIMVESVQDFNEADLGNFCYHLFKNSHPLHWEHRPDQEGRELARLVNNLLETYPELRQTVETQIARPNIRPSIEKMVANKMERLAKLQGQTPAEVPQTATTPDDDNSLRR